MGQLADAIEASDERVGGVECHLGKIIRLMAKEDRDDLTRYLKNLDVSATRITNVLTSLEYDVNVYSVRKHRNRILLRDGLSCRCDIPEEPDDE